MMNDERYVFEVIEVKQENDGWVLKGLAFDTITINDKLTLHDEVSDSPVIQVTQINTYGQKVQELVRGLTGELVIASDEKVDFSDVTHLYRVTLIV